MYSGYSSQDLDHAEEDTNPYGNGVYCYVCLTERNCWKR